MDIVNFIFVYIIAGFILSVFMKRLAKETLDNKLSFLLGYGISPLLISLFLYYLYLFFPKKEWGFYAIIIYLIFFIIALSLKKQFIQFASEVKTIPIPNFLKIFISCNLNKKILLFFVLFMTVFTLTRTIFYHNTRSDAFEYLRQGFVYSQDRNLDRLTTQEPFSNFNKNNPLYGPEKEYLMNSGIRPALPIFYSFFYRSDSPNNPTFSVIEFIYPYYFILLLFLVIYIISRFKKNNVLIGLTFLLSCYFFTSLSYFDYKEIIIAYLSLLSFFILHKLNENRSWFYAIILGLLCGLISYINYSGLVLSGLLFFLNLLFFKSNPKKKISILLLILFAFAIFSGDEVMQYKKFIFFKKFISIENQQKTFESNEFANRLNKINNQAKETSDPQESTRTIMEEKETIVTQKQDETIKKEVHIDHFHILISNKLQIFTNLQVFGLTFWQFLIILILLLVKKIKNDTFSKLNLFFIFLFFLVFSDPFFLNPHLYAYVLSMSYKYMLMLVPFATIFIAFNYEIFLNIINKIKINYLLSIGSLSFFLIKPIRIYLAGKIVFILNNYIILTNPYIYYIEKVNSLLIIVASVSLTIFIVLLFRKNKFKINSQNNPINTSFLLFFFIIPSLFFLNNNQNIINTFRYCLIKDDTKKLALVIEDRKIEEALNVAHYINNNIKNDTTIIINDSLFGSARHNLWFYTNNNKRLLRQEDVSKSEKRSLNNFYLLAKNDKIQISSTINESCMSEKIFSSTILLKCNRN
ncbi:MAG TPA: hypothetical protein P5232_00685 [Candidatus Moranbacteria bacterium]|nr:hypothetical protein [Candidatus Moranbacteria bacterium]